MNTDEKNPTDKIVGSSDGLGADEPNMWTEGSKPVHAKCCHDRGCDMCCKCWCHFEST